MRRTKAPSRQGTADDPAFEQLPPVMTPRMLSELVFRGGITEKTLSKRRLEGGGPMFRRRGHPTRGRVVYLREDVIAWVRSFPAARTTTEERVRFEAGAVPA